MVAQIKPELLPVAELKGPSVAGDIATARRLQSASDELIRAGKTVSQAAIRTRARENREREIMNQTQAISDAALDYSDWYDNVTAKPVLTTSEAMELGAKDDPSLWLDETEGLERDDIYLWDILPDLAKDKYERLITQYSDKFTDPLDRKEWITRTREQGASIYSDLLTEQRKQRFNQSVSKYELSIEANHQSGNHEMAIEMAKSHPIPSERAKAVKVAQIRGETDSLHQVYQDGDLEEVREAVEYLRDPDNKTFLTETQQSAWLNQMKAREQKLISDGATRRSFALDKELADIESKVASGQAGYADVLDFAESLYDRGHQNYIPKGWLASKKKEIDRIQADQLDVQNRIENVYLAMGGTSVVDTSDSKNVEAINHVANQLVTSMAPGAEEDLFRLISSTKFIPDAFQTAMTTSMNDAAPVESVVQAANLYNKLLVESPNALSEVSSDVGIFMRRVYTLSRGGVPTEDAIQAIRDEMRTTEPDVLKYRQSNFDQFSGSGQARTWFEDKFKGDSQYNTFSQRWLWDERTSVSDNMYMDFLQHSEEAMLRGMPQEEAMEYGYGAVANTYTVSNVNGSPEVMRDAPEFRYNVPSEHIRTDLNHQLMHEFNVTSDRVGEYVILPTPRTQFEQFPSYQIYHKDPDTGILIAETDQYRQLVTYQPNLEDIDAKIKASQADYLRQQKRRAIEAREMWNTVERDGAMNPTATPGDFEDTRSHQVIKDMFNAD